MKNDRLNIPDRYSPKFPQLALREEIDEMYKKEILPYSKKYDIPKEDVRRIFYKCINDRIKANKLVVI